MKILRFLTKKSPYAHKSERVGKILFLNRKMQ
jgi:hypothetical protein